MKLTHIVLAALMASSSIGAAAYAADPDKSTAQETKVGKELGRLSTDGATAFRDIRLARIAIFDAEPGKAKSLIEKAQASLKAAKADDTAYLKADGDLVAAPRSVNTAKPDANPTPTPKPAGEEIAWLPIDGQLVLGEDLVSTPKKQAAVKKANQHLQAGDRKTATETLKAADIDVSFTMAVVPLDKTITTAGDAASLIKEGKYYEANAELKQLEDSVRFDTLDVTAG
ncbi:YfdX family protein [Rhizobium sp. NFR03]|uniref:YfdX family protein n=1 Tax=Rhizobium sp. NFR03 TaxID=1566263 RepID=UPI0008D16A85|nr:YfdX family protein [Rhizobium sp. NFR03]SES40970.1 YfdX protein [Rhizobium sp. NFR03]